VLWLNTSPRTDQSVLEKRRVKIVNKRQAGSGTPTFSQSGISSKMLGMTSTANKNEAHIKATACKWIGQSEQIVPKGLIRGKCWEDGPTRSKMFDQFLKNLLCSANPRTTTCASHRVRTSSHSKHAQEIIQTTHRILFYLANTPQL